MAPGSDGGSSSLSDVGDSPDEHQSAEEEQWNSQNQRDNDTEADTERIEPTPKTRRHLRLDDDDITMEEENEPDHPQFDDNMDRSSAVDATSDIGSENGLVPLEDAVDDTAGDLDDDYLKPSLSASSNKKRKRTTSVSEGTRLASKRRSTSSNSAVTAPLIQDDATEENGVTKVLDEDDGLDKGPSDGDEHLSDALEDIKPAQQAAQKTKQIRRRSARHREIEEEDDEVVEEVPPNEEEAEKDEDVEVEEDAVNVEGEADADADEADAAAKNEDELAKKRQAMDDLIPIEKLFALFRDKLFDERLDALAAEEETLRSSTPVHPVLLAQLRCVDARRDETIRLEQIKLDLNVQTLERRMLAERSIAHSRYYQRLRDERELHLSLLLNKSTRVQRERKEFRNKETQYLYLFNSDRQAQVNMQSAYNKEVSLLSGIAKHVGFPAAPELSQAASMDVENDLRRMQIKPQAKSYVAQIANANLVNEMAGEEQFLEKNPWAANPHHSSAHQSMTTDQPGFPHGRKPYAAPMNHPEAGRRPPGHNAMMDSQPESAPTVWGPGLPPRYVPIGGIPDRSPVDRFTYPAANSNGVNKVHGGYGASVDSSPTSHRAPFEGPMPPQPFKHRPALYDSYEGPGYAPGPPGFAAPGRDYGAMYAPELQRRRSGDTTDYSARPLPRPPIPNGGVPRPSMGTAASR